MHQICTRIQQNLFRFNQLMVLIHGMDSSTSPSLVLHFKEAGIKGFAPIQPFQVASNLAITDWCAAFHWPSLLELNDKFAPFPWANDDEFQRYIHGDSITKLPALAMGSPPAAPAHSIPKIPAIHLLTAAIISSVDRLFFVSHSTGANTSREWRLVRIAFSN